MGHNYIGTEHVLLGLIHEGEGVAAKTLAQLDIPLEKVRHAVVEVIGQGGSSPSGHIPFTPRATKVLELSLREALQLGHNYIGTEHILLGLIREGEGVGAQVLVRLGADLSRVRQMIIQILSGYRQAQERGAAITPPPAGSVLVPLHPDAHQRVLDWLQQWNRTYGPLDPEHPARVLMVALEGAQTST